MWSWEGGQGRGCHGARWTPLARYKRNTLYAYNITGMKCFQNVGHVSISLDGVKAGNRKNLVSAIYSCDNDRAMWLPIGDFRGAGAGSASVFPK